MTRKFGIQSDSFSSSGTPALGTGSWRKCTPGDRQASGDVASFMRLLLDGSRQLGCHPVGNDPIHVQIQHSHKTFLMC